MLFLLLQGLVYPQPLHSFDVRYRLEATRVYPPDMTGFGAMTSSPEE